VFSRIGGSNYIEEGLRDGWRKVSIRGSMKEKGTSSFWYAISCCCNFQTTRLVVDELRYIDNLIKYLFRLM
jgi:hypothetical protein